jgi:hypothetical protein
MHNEVDLGACDAEAVTKLQKTQAHYWSERFFAQLESFDPTPVDRGNGLQALRRLAVPIVLPEPVLWLTAILMPRPRGCCWRMVDHTSDNCTVWQRKAVLP